MRELYPTPGEIDVIFFTPVEIGGRTSWHLNVQEEVTARNYHISANNKWVAAETEL